MKKEKTIICKSCKSAIRKKAKHCPECGAKNKKPIFKRWWFWLLIIALIGTAIPNNDASSSSSNEDNASISQEDPSTLIDSSAPEETSETAPEESSVFVTEENTVLYSNDGIELIYTGIKSNKYFSYEIANNSDSDVQCCINAVSVNGCIVVDAFAVHQITVGNKAVEKYTLEGTNAYDIDTIETLDIYFTITEVDGFTPIDKVICHVVISPTIDFEYTCSDTPFYEDEYIAAYAVQDGDGFDDFHVIYFNKTDDIVTAALSDISINGIMLNYNAKQSAYILPGCYAHTGASNGTITVWDPVEEEIEEKELEPINHVEAKLIIFGDTFDLSSKTTENLVVIN